MNAAAAVTDFYYFLLSVAFISLSGVMMPGPVFAMAVAKGYKDRRAGILIALGHAAVEFPLMFLIFFGFTWFFSSITVQKVVGLDGALIMIYTGLSLFKTQEKENEEQADSKRGSFVVGVLTTVANPYFFLWWITIGAALILNASAFGFTAFLAFTLVHWSCDLFWDAFVSASVYGTRRFWTAKAYKLVFAFCFIVLVAFGVWFIVSALLL